jgi:hypothetical protein
MSDKPQPRDSWDDPPGADTENGDDWVIDQALELHKLISDRHAPIQERPDKP